MESVADSAGPSRSAALTRRSFAALCGSATGVVLAGPVPDAAAAASFRALSARLAGFDEAALDLRFASELRLALLAAGHGANLARLSSSADAPADAMVALEADIIAAWYSGVLPGAEPVVATLHGALIWAAAPFATPPGMCDGGGGWGGAPAGAPR